MLKKILGPLYGPINCGCSKTYCSPVCGPGVTGTKVSVAWDCSTGYDCGSVIVGATCSCRLPS